MPTVFRLLLSLFLLVALTFPLRAQTLIRDAEIEHALRELASPVLIAAGLSPARIRILVIKDHRLNAFIIDTQHIFINSGLIQRLDRPEMLQSVIAHEAAHIANGHISRRLQNLRASRSLAGLGLLLSAAVAASGNTQAAMGTAAGTSSAAQRSYLAHTRDQESSADQSAARYLSRAGIDPAAMIDVLEIFRGQEALAANRQDPYALSHPLSRERLRRAQAYAAAYPAQGTADQNSAYWFARARGKLGAFIGNPGRTLRQLRGAEANDIVLMQRAVAYHRVPDVAKALENIDALVRRRGSDPYVHELRGQILFESRNFGAAVNAYGRAVQLAPDHPLILAGYGQALLALSTADANARALRVLERSYARDARNSRMLRDLAVAYARSGNNGMASTVTAERYAMNGRFEDSLVHARRAEAQLPRGSPGWNRAQDVILAAEAAQNQRRRNR